MAYKTNPSKTYSIEQMEAEVDNGESILACAYKKWRAILEGGADLSTGNCAMCYADKDDVCDCLISKHGRPCSDRKAPYRKWIEHHEQEHFESYAEDDLYIECEECEAIAVRMIMLFDHIAREEEAGIDV